MPAPLIMAAVYAVDWLYKKYAESGEPPVSSPPSTPSPQDVDVSPPPHARANTPAAGQAEKQLIRRGAPSATTTQEPLPNIHPTSVLADELDYELVVPLRKDGSTPNSSGAYSTAARH